MREQTADSREQRDSKLRVASEGIAIEFPVGCKKPVPCLEQKLDWLGKIRMRRPRQLGCSSCNAKENATQRTMKPDTNRVTWRESYLLMHE